MTRARPLPFAILLACSLRELPAASATDGDGTSSTTFTDPPATTSSTSATSSPATSDTAAVDDSGQPFIAPHDLPPGPRCDVWFGDCPEGQTCTLAGSQSDSHCVDIADDPQQLYEPCQLLMGGYLSGHDDCDAGLICWNVDPDSGIGTCIGLCHGSSEQPMCDDPKSSCHLCQECFGICLPPCNPLLQDCLAETDLCLPNAFDPNGFVCVFDASGEEGQVFDVCEFINACDPGLLCASPALAEECDPMAAGCCLPFCDLTVMPPPCPGAGQQCLPWFEGGQAPQGLENVGVCGIPQ